MERVLFIRIIILFVFLTKVLSIQECGGVRNSFLNLLCYVVEFLKLCFLVIFTKKKNIKRGKPFQELRLESVFL